MSIRKNRLRLVIFATIFAVIMLFSFGYLQTFYLGDQQSLVQYNIDSEDLSIAVSPDGAYFTALGGSNGQVVGTSQSSPGSNTLSASTTSNIVTINNGKHVYEFNTEKTGDGRTLGLSIPENSVGGYCWQRVGVKRDGVTINTLKSWGDDAHAWNTKDHFKSNDYVVYDDSSQDSGIRLRMDDLGEGQQYGRFNGDCRIFVNTYQLFYDNETLDVNIDVPQQSVQPGENISVTVNIENNLNIPITSNVTTEFSVGTFLGPTALTSTQTVTLNPGQNMLTYQVPAPAENEEIEVNVNAKLSLTGSQLQNLNNGQGTLSLGTCFNTNGAGNCEMYRIYNGAGASPTIAIGQKVDIGSFIEAESSLQVSLSPGSNNVVVQASQSGSTTSSSNQPSSVLSYQSGRSSKSTMIIGILVLSLIVVVIAGVFISKRKR